MLEYKYLNKLIRAFTQLDNKYLAGFTLIELITVVIVIGILVALVVPQYMITIERSRTAEGVSILNALRQAELRFYVEHNGVYTNDPDAIDVTIPTTTYFSPIYIGSNGICQANRNSNQFSFGSSYYNLFIEPDGDISCTGDQGLCLKLGFAYYQSPVTPVGPQQVDQ